MFTGLLLYLSFGEEKKNVFFSLFYSSFLFSSFSSYFMFCSLDLPLCFNYQLASQTTAPFRYLVRFTICRSACVLSHCKDLNCLSSFHQKFYVQYISLNDDRCYAPDNTYSQWQHGARANFWYRSKLDPEMMYGNRSWRKVQVLLW